MDQTPTPGSLRVLDRDECLRLLVSQPVGRLALGRGDDGPLVVPVNYLVHQSSIVFRTDEGTKLSLLPGRVSFQIDGFDWGRQSGWSVLVVGKATAATDSEVEHLGLTAWAGLDKPYWFLIPIEEITGRAIQLAEVRSTDNQGYV